MVCGAETRHELLATSQPGEAEQLKAEQLQLETKDGDVSRYPCQPDASQPRGG